MSDHSSKPSKFNPNHSAWPVPHYYDSSSSGSSSLDRLLDAKVGSSIRKNLTSNLKSHPLAPNTISESHNQHTPSQHHASSVSKVAHNNDRDLVTIMASRLAKLEDELKECKTALSVKDKTVVKLNKQIADHKQESTRLKHEQNALKNQIHEMETFLNDYGLVWVGGDSDSDDNGDGASGAKDDEEDDQQQRTDESFEDDGDGLVFKDGADEYPVLLAGGEKQFRVDMEKIKRNIAELNFLAGEGKAEVVHSKGGMYRLREPDSVSLTFYKNGFLLFSGPFRPYSLPSSLPFVKDISDGYFPYELKDRYPDGVPFKLVDKSTEVYTPPSQAFSGTGATTTKKSNNIHSLSANSGSNSSSSSSSGESVSKDAFLKRLPSSVIKNGRVIDIRKSIANNIFKESEPAVDSIVIASTDVVSYLCGDATPAPITASSTPAPPSSSSPSKHAEEGIFAAEYKGRPTTPHTVTTLKIKTYNIGTLIVKLNFSDTVATLRKYIDQYTKEGGAYELRTTFPSKVYANPSATLLEEGLVPNATMYMKPTASA